MPRPYFFVALAVLVGSLLSACSLHPDPRSSIHLVIDAGSSGTRFCAFPVRRGKAGLCEIAASGPSDPCFSVEARNGLADLSPAEVDRVLEDGLSRLKRDGHTSVERTVLLGTGGYRRKSEVEQSHAMNRIQRWFEARGVPAEARVINGDEEGRLAWQTVRALTGSVTHAIVETGGATVQLAGRDGDGIRAVSAPIGMTAARARIRSGPDDAACTNGNGRAGECIALLAERIFRDSALARPGFGVSSTLFAMGAPWNVIFDRYLKSDRTTVAALRATADRVCAMPTAAVIAQGYAEGSFAQSACFLTAYHVAKVETIGSIESIRRVGESWPRGAAIDPRHFAACESRGAF